MGKILRIPIIKLITIFFILIHITLACTTGLVTANATADDRALLWKNRDTSHEDNELMYFRHADVHFIAIINVDDTSQVWAGINNFGFAIINAESRDMGFSEKNTQYDGEGFLMKKALIKCKTIDDFEKMLIATNDSRRDVTSNFGIIDATGNAAYFETGNRIYFRIDADDQNETKTEFLVRANFAKHGKGDEVYGKIRYEKAEDFFQQAVKNNCLDYKYIISKVSPDISLPGSIGKKEVFRKTQDTINRYSSVSAAVFQGTKKNEPAELATFWCTLGKPIVSISVPLWVYAEKIPNKLNAKNGAPLNQIFQEIKTFAYPDTTNNKMLEVETAIKIHEKMQWTQNSIFRKTERKLKKWRQNPPAAEEVAKFQKEMVECAYKRAEKILKKFKNKQL